MLLQLLKIGFSGFGLVALEIEFGLQQTGAFLNSSFYELSLLNDSVEPLVSMQYGNYSCLLFYLLSLFLVSPHHLLLLPLGFLL